MQFGKCLSELLRVLEISRSKLAKGINVDPSMVSRWITGKRALPPKSNYLELISNYLSDNMINTLQEENIKSIVTHFNIQVSIEDCSNMKEYIHKLLTASQQETEIEHPNNTNKWNEHIPEASMSNSYELILGHSNIVEAGIELLKSALEKPCNSTTPIITTFYTDLDSFGNFENYDIEWNDVLSKVLKKGWNIKKLIRITENMDRNFKIINELKTHFSTGRYDPYYINKYCFIDRAIDYIIVPTIGTLVCIGSQNNKRFDSAFLVKDQHTTCIIQGFLMQFFNQSSPLISSKYQTRNVDLASEIAEIEEQNGNRYAFKYGLSIITIPLNIFESYLLSKNRERSKEEITKQILYHEKRLEGFYKQVENYKYYDICSKKSIEEMINFGNYHCYKIKISIVLEHLKNVVYMLEKHDNYQIALLNDNQIKNVEGITCMIKDSHGVLMQNHNLLKQVSCNNNKEISISIYEPIIVNAFKNYFMDLWNEIPSVNKKKPAVISWFKEKIKSIS